MGDDPGLLDESSSSSGDSKGSEEVETSRKARKTGLAWSEARIMLEKKRKELEKCRVKGNGAIAPAPPISKERWKWLIVNYIKKNMNEIKEREKFAALLLRRAIEETEIYKKLCEVVLISFGKEKMGDVYKDIWRQGWPHGLFKVFLRKFFDFELLHCVYRWRNATVEVIRSKYYKLLWKQRDMMKKVEEDIVLQHGEFRMVGYFYSWFMKRIGFEGKRNLCDIYESDRRSRVMAASAEGGDTDSAGARAIPPVVIGLIIVFV